jgi:hypothetical protein
MIDGKEAYAKLTVDEHLDLATRKKRRRLAYSGFAESSVLPDHFDAD